MKYNFIAKIYFKLDLTSKANFTSFWKNFGELFHPDRFDSVERMRNDYKLDLVKEGYGIFSETYSILFKKDSKFITSFTSTIETYGINHLVFNCNFNEKEIEGFISDLMQLGILLNAELVIACPDKEYSMKHEFVEKLAGGGQIISWKGVSLAEYKECLPGIYWFNFFHKSIIKKFDSDRLNRLFNDQNLISIKNEHGVMLRFKDQAFLHDYSERIKYENVIASSLGGLFLS